MITVNWATKVISIEKEDMILVQSNPFEIWKLDLNDFRLILKDHEDDEEGMPFLHTHNHTAPLTVGGVTLARSVEMINGYTVTFENGSYAVSLVGGNSNIADVTNLNSVSVRSANSAGFVQGPGSDPGDIASAVWDEPRTGHATSDTFGEGVASVQGNITGSVASIAAGDRKSVV